MKDDTIVDVRAYIVHGGGGDYHDQAGGHWIDNHIASPMAKYPEYRETRSSFGINVLGSLVVEIESRSGEVGFAVSTGGVPGCWVVEEHLSRFLMGRQASEVEKIWDQMYLGSLYYGRKGLVVNAISAVDLALWDLLGRLRQEPVYQMIGGMVRDEIRFYATGTRPDLVKDLGFIGGKMPLLHGPAEGEDGLEQNVELLAAMRRRVGDDFWLMYDCWMSLDVPYALRLMKMLEPHRLMWLEEALPPDDYWGYADLHRRRSNSVLVTTGEHEATRWGFRLLLEMECCDIIQPDLGWCGGLTELLKISALADSRGVLVIPHGSSVYSYHFVITRHNSPFAEFLMMAPGADRVVPMFSPLLINESVPENGRMRVPNRPGFGVELNRAGLERPFGGERRSL